MQVVVRIVIILVAILLIWILRKWIKRIIFIAILLCLAFFIYGIFSPSWASRLWYNVRTFPKRVTSWVSDKTFLDYDSYKLNISSVWKKDDVEFPDNNKEWLESNVKENDWDVIVHSFSGVDVVNFSHNYKAKEVVNSWNLKDGYSRYDIFDIVSKYVEDNLSDDVDILVTIEYDQWEEIPQRIILNTQKKVNNSHFVSAFNLPFKTLFSGKRLAKAKTLLISNDYNQNVDVIPGNTTWLSNEWIKNVDVNKTVNKKNTVVSASNWLSQKDIKDAEELFSVLF